jgi:hypothetical protein
MVGGAEKLLIMVVKAEKIYLIARKNLTLRGIITGDDL